MCRCILRRSLILILVAWTTGCVGANRQLYFEPSIPRGSAKLRRVAIVPNRLPLNLAEPEKWRRWNWKLTATLFAKRGFEVVDYKTSVKYFRRSGLPLEDTKSSRDKYADLARKLGADAIIVPYYGTFSETRVAFLASTMHWYSLVTFQIYLVEKNDFFSRIDAEGHAQYMSGVGSLVGFPLMFVNPIIGSIVLIGGSLIDLGFTVLKSSDSYWRSAFEKGIDEGLQPFFEVYPRPNK